MLVRKAKVIAGPGIALHALCGLEGIRREIGAYVGLQSDLEMQRLRDALAALTRLDLRLQNRGREASRMTSIPDD